MHIIKQYFHCSFVFCSKYHKGAQVNIRLKDLEVSDHFIGATKEFSILEADAELIGFVDRDQVFGQAKLNR